MFELCRCRVANFTSCSEFMSESETVAKNRIEFQWGSKLQGTSSEALHLPVMCKKNKLIWYWIEQLLGYTAFDTFRLNQAQGYSNYLLTVCAAQGLKLYPYLGIFLTQKKKNGWVHYFLKIFANRVPFRSFFLSQKGLILQFSENFCDMKPRPLCENFPLEHYKALLGLSRRVAGELPWICGVM